MKKLLILEACLLAFASSPAVAQTGGPDLVLVRFSHALGGKLLVVITRGEGKSEVLYFARNNGTDKGEMVTSDAIYKVLHQFYQEGYALTSSTAEEPGRFEWVLTKGH